MVVAAAQIPVSREDVAAWVKTWKRMKAGRPPIEDYIRAQIDDLHLDVDMVSHAINGDTIVETHIADRIIDDLESYGVTPGS